MSGDEKTFDGEKNRWDWRLHADSVQEDIRGKERRGSFGSLRMAESESVVALLCGPHRRGTTSPFMGVPILSLGITSKSHMDCNISFLSLCDVYVRSSSSLSIGGPFAR